MSSSLVHEFAQLVACLIPTTGEGVLSDEQVSRFLELQNLFSPAEIERARDVARDFEQDCGPLFDELYMSSGGQAVVNVDLVNLSVVPRNLQLQVGDTLAFRNAAAEARSASCNTVCLQVVRMDGLADADSTQQGQRHSSRDTAGQQQSELVWELDSLQAGASPSGWTVSQPGSYTFHSEVYPFIRGAITVMPQASGVAESEAGGDSFSVSNRPAGQSWGHQPPRPPPLQELQPACPEVLRAQLPALATSSSASTAPVPEFPKNACQAPDASRAPSTGYGSLLREQDGSTVAGASVRPSTFTRQMCAQPSTAIDAQAVLAEAAAAASCLAAAAAAAATGGGSDTPSVCSSSSSIEAGGPIGLGSTPRGLQSFLWNAKDSTPRMGSSPSRGPSAFSIEAAAAAVAAAPHRKAAVVGQPLLQHGVPAAGDSAGTGAAPVQPWLPAASPSGKCNGDLFGRDGHTDARDRSPGSRGSDAEGAHMSEGEGEGMDIDMQEAPCGGSTTTSEDDGQSDSHLIDQVPYELFQEDGDCQAELFSGQGHGSHHRSGAGKGNGKADAGSAVEDQQQQKQPASVRLLQDGGIMAGPPPQQQQQQQQGKGVPVGAQVYGKRGAIGSEAQPTQPPPQVQAASGARTEVASKYAGPVALDEDWYGGGRFFTRAGSVSVDDEGVEMVEMCGLKPLQQGTASGTAGEGSLRPGWHQAGPGRGDGEAGRSAWTPGAGHRSSGSSRGGTGPDAGQNGRSGDGDKSKSSGTVATGNSLKAASAPTSTSLFSGSADARKQKLGQNGSAVLSESQATCIAAVGSRSWRPYQCSVCGTPYISELNCKRCKAWHSPLEAQLAAAPKHTNSKQNANALSVRAKANRAQAVKAKEQLRADMQAHWEQATDAAKCAILGLQSEVGTADLLLRTANLPFADCPSPGKFIYLQSGDHLLEMVKMYHRAGRDAVERCSLPEWGHLAHLMTQVSEETMGYCPHGAAIGAGRPFPCEVQDLLLPCSKEAALGLLLERCMCASMEQARKSSAAEAEAKLLEELQADKQQDGAGKKASKDKKAGKGKKAGSQAHTTKAVAAAANGDPASTVPAADEPTVVSAKPISDGAADGVGSLGGEQVDEDGDQEGGGSGEEDVVAWARRRVEVSATGSKQQLSGPRGSATGVLPKGVKADKGKGSKASVPVIPTGGMLSGTSAFESLGSKQQQSIGGGLGRAGTTPTPASDAVGARAKAVPPRPLVVSSSADKVAPPGRNISTSNTAVRPLLGMAPAAALIAATIAGTAKMCLPTASNGSEEDPKPAAVPVAASHAAGKVVAAIALQPAAAKQSSASVPAAGTPAGPSAPLPAAGRGNSYRSAATGAPAASGMAAAAAAAAKLHAVTSGVASSAAAAAAPAFTVGTSKKGTTDNAASSATTSRANVEAQKRVVGSAVAQSASIKATRQEAAAAAATVPQPPAAALDTSKQGRDALPAAAAVRAASGPQPAPSKVSARPPAAAGAASAPSMAPTHAVVAAPLGSQVVPSDAGPGTATSTSLQRASAAATARAGASPMTASVPTPAMASGTSAGSALQPSTSMPSAEALGITLAITTPPASASVAASAKTGHLAASLAATATVEASIMASKPASSAVKAGTADSAPTTVGAAVTIAAPGTAASAAFPADDAPAATATPAAAATWHSAPSMGLAPTAATTPTPMTAFAPGTAAPSKPVPVGAEAEVSPVPGAASVPFASSPAPEVAKVAEPAAGPLPQHPDVAPASSEGLPLSTGGAEQSSGLSEPEGTPLQTHPRSSKQQDEPRRLQQQASHHPGVLLGPSVHGVHGQHDMAHQAGMTPPLQLGLSMPIHPPPPGYMGHAGPMAAPGPMVLPAPHTHAHAPHGLPGFPYALPVQHAGVPAPAVMQDAAYAPSSHPPGPYSRRSGGPARQLTAQQGGMQDMVQSVPPRHLQQPHTPHQPLSYPYTGPGHTQHYLPQQPHVLQHWQQQPHQPHHLQQPKQPEQPHQPHQPHHPYQPHLPYPVAHHPGMAGPSHPGAAMPQLHSHVPSHAAMQPTMPHSGVGVARPTAMHVPEQRMSHSGESSHATLGVQQRHEPHGQEHHGTVPHLHGPQPESHQQPRPAQQLQQPQEHDDAPSSSLRSPHRHQRQLQQLPAPLSHAAPTPGATQLAAGHATSSATALTTTKQLQQQPPPPNAVSSSSSSVRVDVEAQEPRPSQYPPHLPHSHAQHPVQQHPQPYIHLQHPPQYLGQQPLNSHMHQHRMPPQHFGGVHVHHPAMAGPYYHAADLGAHAYPGDMHAHQAQGEAGQWQYHHQPPHPRRSSQGGQQDSSWWQWQNHNALFWQRQQWIATQLQQLSHAGPGGDMPSHFAPPAAAWPHGYASEAQMITGAAHTPAPAEAGMASAPGDSLPPAERAPLPSSRSDGAGVASMGPMPPVHAGVAPATASTASASVAEASGVDHEHSLAGVEPGAASGARLRVSQGGRSTDAPPGRSVAELGAQRHPLDSGSNASQGSRRGSDGAADVAGPLGKMAMPVLEGEADHPETAAAEATTASAFAGASETFTPVSEPVVRAAETPAQHEHRKSTFSQLLSGAFQKATPAALLQQAPEQEQERQQWQQSRQAAIGLPCTSTSVPLPLHPQQQTEQPASDASRRISRVSNSNDGAEGAEHGIEPHALATRRFNPNQAKQALADRWKALQSAADDTRPGACAMAVTASTTSATLGDADAVGSNVTPLGQKAAQLLVPGLAAAAGQVPDLQQQQQQPTPTRRQLPQQQYQVARSQQADGKKPGLAAVPRVSGASGRAVAGKGSRK